MHKAISEKYLLLRNSLSKSSKVPYRIFSALSFSNQMVHQRRTYNFNLSLTFLDYFSQKCWSFCSNIINQTHTLIQIVYYNR